VTDGGRFLREVSTAPEVESPTFTPPLADLLDGVEDFLRSYVAFRDTDQSAAVALHVPHAHTITAAETTAYIHFTSATKRSGKTRAQEAYEPLVPNPLRVASVSDAALFRTLAQDSNTTLLLDEVDAIFRPKSDREELRALLNAGYRRGAYVARCETVGRSIEVRRYDAFGAKVLAGIGDLPDTIADRCIRIVLARRGPGETVRRFRYREALEEARPLREGLERWAADAIDRLREARPSVPEALHDRAADGWEPLLAIADMAGGDWPRRARAAALALHGDGQASEEALGVQLLADVRSVFEARGTDRLTTVEIVEGLMEIGDGPWPEWWSRQVRDGDVRGPGRRIARLLKDFAHSRDLRTEDGTRKGYLAADLADSWTRYLPPSPQEPQKERDNATSQVEAGFQPEASDQTEEQKTGPDQGRNVVALETRDKGPRPEDRQPPGVGEPRPRVTEPEAVAKARDLMPATAREYIETLHRDGEGDETIAVMLKSAGYPPPPGAASWTGYMVRRVTERAGGLA